MFAKLDFSYGGGLDHTVIDEYPCHEGSDCCDNDYCRCRNITGCEITIVNFDKIVESIISNAEYHFKRKLNAVERYGIDRLARKHKLYNSDSYRGDWRGGYYGDEFEGVFLEDEEFYRELDQFFIMPDDNAKVEYLLEMEYGSVPTQYRLRKWSVVDFPTKGINVPNAMHFSRAASAKHYQNHKGIVAVCIQDGVKVTLIDGYHRLATNYGVEFSRILLGTR